MKGLHVALALMLLTGSASAQGVNLLRGDGEPKSMEDIVKEQEVEQAYKKRMKQIPDQKGPTDPWGNVRSTEPAKTTTTTARKPKPQQ
jgi:hypothetical protein